MDTFLILDMINDYLTKALQGYQFSYFCYTIIGIHDDEITFIMRPE